METENGKLIFSHISIQGKDKNANTDKVSGFFEENKLAIVLVDPSTGSSWGENFASLLAGSISDGLQELMTDEFLQKDITEIEEEIKRLIKDKVKEAGNSIPHFTLTTAGEVNVHLAVLVWFSNTIISLAAGKVSIYKVEDHQLKAIYLLMDKPPIKMNITGNITKFALAINSFDATDKLSSTIVASDGFYTFLKNPKIHNLLARVDSPRSILTKLEEYLNTHKPDDNATIIIAWREKEIEEIPAEELPTLSTKTMAAGILAGQTASKVPSDYRKTYDKTTVEKLTQTLRNIQETEIGQEIVKQKEDKRKRKKKKSSRLLAQPRERREISPIIAIIIVILFILLFGGFLYIRYGDTIKQYFSSTTHTEQSYNNNGKQSTSTTNNGNNSGTGSTTATNTNTSSTTVITPTTGNTSTTSETETSTTSETTGGTVTSSTASTTTSTEQITSELKTFSAITKPSGLRITLIQTDNKGNQIKVIKSCKAPCTIKAPIDMKNPMFVAMYMGSVCASYPKPNGTGWTIADLKDKIILDCRYIAEEDPEKPILLTTNPSNIRIKIFDASGKEIFSALSPVRIPVMGDKDEYITIKAFIKGKQCAAYKGTWSDAVKLKHIHLVCKQ